ncbi:MAG TPA: prolyl oligopeptidase family serine peptidase [Gemmataceae bacterium]|jgi:prolyl oligopeptidase
MSARLLFATAAILAGCCAAAADLPPVPATSKKPVRDTYHGVTVTDDYRWLENDDDPAVRVWVEAQNHRTRAALDASPALPELRKRMRELLGAPTTRFYALQRAGGKLFALKRQPPKEQPVLVTLSSANDPASAHTVLDPTALDPTGKTAIDFFVASRDGKLVAVSLSKGGSEEGTLHVYDVSAAAERPDVIPRVLVATGGGDVAWDADGTGFYYTRYPHLGERPKGELDFFINIYHHRLGTPPADDRYEVGKDWPKIAEPALTTSADGRWVLATIQNGDGGEFAHYLRDPAGKWTQITHFADQYGVAAFAAGDDPSLYLFARAGAPNGKIIRVPLDHPDPAKATVAAPEGPLPINAMAWSATMNVFGATFVPTPGGIYVLYSDGGPSRLRFVARNGRDRDVPLPPVCAVDAIVPAGGDDVFADVSTFTSPADWYAVRDGGARVDRTALVQKSPADFGDIEVTRAFATSKDGTTVPLTILARKGTPRDGTAPALLTGYGGFGMSRTPHLNPAWRVWFDAGGVAAVANLRGGGEYGEAWHRAGNLTHKQNVFDDFTACARYLIDQHYTNPQRLAIEGGSNGGLLVAAAMTQHPDLYRAVVAHVGLYDMLRFERYPNGVYNVTEYGSVKDPEQFKALHAYSPYHHVKDGTAYPAVLLLSGANDARVAPADSRKLAARLQAATSSGRPVYLLTRFDAGHGIGASLSQRVEDAADVDAFLFEQLGMSLKH